MSDPTTDSPRDTDPVAGVRYLVDAIAPAVAFSTERLGFRAGLVAEEEVAVLRHGALQLVLSGPASSAAAPVGDVVPRPGGWNRSQATVEDVHETWRVRPRDRGPQRGCR